MIFIWPDGRVHEIRAERRGRYILPEVLGPEMAGFFGEEEPTSPRSRMKEHVFYCHRFCVGGTDKWWYVHEELSSDEALRLIIARGIRPDPVPRPARGRE